ncbi:MAG: carbon starvation protein A [Terriglobia bacterium]
MTPFWFVVSALLAYGIAFRVYGKWYDRKVWRPDPKRMTPAHMYLDGVEFFPVSRYVLWGYQFKSVAALGPILGPFIALTYGWLPALLWIIIGNFFIGWLQDYGSIMVSVRNEGRSFGPLSYEFTGPKGRATLLGFILFYLVIISAVVIFLVATFWNVFPGTFVATLGVFATGMLAGHLLYKRRMNVVRVTLLALGLVVVSIVLGLKIQTPKDFLGGWTIPFWAAVTCVVLYFASVLPLPKFIQPVNYVAFFPAFTAIILIIVGSLLSPATGVGLRQPAWRGFYDSAVGPLWPMMFVAIACGSISGWHSLVGSSSTSKQLDIETDAHPVGAGAMLSEGLLALASLAAYMVLAPAETSLQSFDAWVTGAVRLTSPFLGGQAAVAVLTTYFGLMLVLYGLTVQALVTRFWRLVCSEVTSGTRFALLGQKHVASFTGVFLPWIFAISGSWYSLWLYFGGANQLLAGLALMLISIYLAKVKRWSKFTFLPAVFMMVTTLSALAVQTWFFIRAGYIDKVPLIRAPLSDYPLIAFLINNAFIGVGVVLILLGLRMASLTLRAYRHYAALPAVAPADD